MTAPSLVGRRALITGASSGIGAALARGLAAQGVTAWSECLAVEIWDTPVSVHLVNPGVVDTELFHLPGNDAPLAAVDPLAAGRTDGARP